MQIIVTTGGSSYKQGRTDMESSKFGRLSYTANGENEEIIFQYPSNSRWTCIRCGDCCKDVPGHTRRILLTGDDLKLIRATTGLNDFYESTDEKNFEAVMKKNDGTCVFLRDESCTIYDSRALLCRMYPFWVECNKIGFVIKMDKRCRGVDIGDKLDEGFFVDLLNYALEKMGY